MPISLFLNEKFIKFAHEKAIKVEHMNEKLILSEDGKAVLEADHSIIHAVIPEGVTEIGGGTFSNSRVLRSVSIPSTVKKIVNPFIAVELY